MRTIARVLVPLALSLLGSPLFGAPHTPVVTLTYTTAETSTSVTVGWQTNVASDSLLRYSTSNPIPADAPRVYLADPVIVHEIPLGNLSPGTLYYFQVTSCAKRRCGSASDTFDTYPICPDEVPPVSGSWQEEATPNVGGLTVTNQLLAVAATADNDVWAVGWAQDPAGPPYVKRTLIAHFDGASWNIVPSPNPVEDYASVLNAVSGTSPGDVWAVGSSHHGEFPSRTLIEHWDGTQWSIVPSPNPGLHVNELLGVAAVAANDVWAVGYHFGPGSEANIDTLVLHWDGIAWTQVPSPNPVTNAANQLFGVGALSASDVWAVGSTGGAPLALHWNGSAWRSVAVEMNGGSSGEWLSGVAGAAGEDVWAVGRSRGFFTNRTSTSLRHWDGVHWTEKVCYARSASNPPMDYEGGGPDSYFNAVSAAAGGDVWAVGVAGAGPLLKHWDGAAWTTVIHPRAYPSTGIVRGVATASDGSAWAVGGKIVALSSSTFSAERTLVYRYTP